jgi:hypothetical protein
MPIVIKNSELGGAEFLNPGGSCINRPGAFSALFQFLASDINPLLLRVCGFTPKAKYWKRA